MTFIPRRKDVLAFIPTVEGETMKMLWTVVLLGAACTAFAEYPYPDSQPCPQDGQTAFVQGLCHHGNDATVCTYSHDTGKVDSSGRTIKHTFTVAFSNK